MQQRPPFERRTERAHREAREQLASRLSSDERVVGLAFGYRGFHPRREGLWVWSLIFVVGLLVIRLISRPRFTGSLISWNSAVSRYNQLEDRLLVSLFAILLFAVVLQAASFHLTAVALTQQRLVLARLSRFRRSRRLVTVLDVSGEPIGAVEVLARRERGRKGGTLEIRRSDNTLERLRFGPKNWSTAEAIATALSNGGATSSIGIPASARARTRPSRQTLVTLAIGIAAALFVGSRIFLAPKSTSFSVALGAPISSDRYSVTVTNTGSNAAMPLCFFNLLDQPGLVNAIPLPRLDITVPPGQARTFTLTLTPRLETSAISSLACES